MILGILLMIFAIISCCVAYILHFNIMGKYKDALQNLLDLSIIIDAFLVILILYFTSVHRQTEYEFWVNQFIDSHNGTRIATDFRTAFETSDDVTSFIRERTVIVHDTVLICSCFWFIIYLISPRISLPPPPSQTPEMKPDIVVTIEEAPESDKPIVSITETPPVTPEIPAIPIPKVLVVETRLSSGTNSGTDEEYLSHSGNAPSSQRRSARRSHTEIPSSLRPLHLEEVEDSEPEVRSSRSKQPSKWKQMATTFGLSSDTESSVLTSDSDLLY